MLSKHVKCHDWQLCSAPDSFRHCVGGTPTSTLTQDRISFHTGCFTMSTTTSLIFVNGRHSWVWANVVSLQRGHQHGDPGGHRDQTKPSLPDQRRGPNSAPGLCCHGHCVRRGGASGLQFQEGRGIVRLCTGTVAGSVDQGGAPRRHAGSTGEHPQRPGDVGHAVRRHRGADVWWLWLTPPEKLSPAAACLLPNPEPRRRPSLSCRQQRHPLRLREKLLSWLHTHKTPPQHPAANSELSSNP